MASTQCPMFVIRARVLVVYRARGLYVCFSFLLYLAIEFRSQGRKKAMNQMWDKTQGIAKDNATTKKASTPTTTVHKLSGSLAFDYINVLLCTSTGTVQGNIHTECMTNDYIVCY